MHVQHRAGGCEGWLLTDARSAQRPALQPRSTNLAHLLSQAPPSAKLLHTRPAGCLWLCCTRQQQVRERWMGSHDTRAHARTPSCAARIASIAPSPLPPSPLLQGSQRCASAAGGAAPSLPVSLNLRHMCC